MSRRSSFAPILFATCTLALLGSTAQAAVEFDDATPSSYDKLGTVHRTPSGDISLRSSDFSSEDLQKLRDALKNTSAEVEKLKRTVDDQARTIADLKRNNGSSSNSGDLFDIKRELRNQGSDLQRLQRDVDHLNRKVR